MSLNDRITSLLGAISSSPTTADIPVENPPQKRPQSLQSLLLGRQAIAGVTLSSRPPSDPTIRSSIADLNLPATSLEPSLPSLSSAATPVNKLPPSGVAIENYFSSELTDELPMPTSSVLSTSTNLTPITPEKPVGHIRSTNGELRMENIYFESDDSSVKFTTQNLLPAKAELLPLPAESELDGISVMVYNDEGEDGVDGLCAFNDIPVLAGYDTSTDHKSFLEAQKNELKSEHEGRTKELAALNDQLTRENQELRSKNEMMTLQTNRQTADMTDLSDQLVAEGSIHRQLQVDLESVQRDRAHLRRLASTLEGEVKRLELALNERAVSHTHMNESMVASEKLISQLESEGIVLSQIRGELEIAERDRAQLRRLVASMESEVLTLKTENSHLRCDLANAALSATTTAAPLTSSSSFSYPAPLAVSVPAPASASAPAFISNDNSNNNATCSSSMSSNIKTNSHINSVDPTTDRVTGYGRRKTLSSIELEYGTTSRSPSRPPHAVRDPNYTNHPEPHTHQTPARLPLHSQHRNEPPHQQPRNHQPQQHSLQQKPPHYEISEYHQPSAAAMPSSSSSSSSSSPSSSVPPIHSSTQNTPASLGISLGPSAGTSAGTSSTGIKSLAQLMGAGAGGRAVPVRRNSVSPDENLPLTTNDASSGRQYGGDGYGYEGGLGGEGKGRVNDGYPSEGHPRGVGTAGEGELLNLTAWKREGYPSEHAYSRAKEGVDGGRAYAQAHTPGHVHVPAQMFTHAVSTTGTGTGTGAGRGLDPGSDAGFGSRSRVPPNDVSHEVAAVVASFRRSSIGHSLTSSGPTTAPFGTDHTANQDMVAFDDLEKHLTTIMTEKRVLNEESERLLQRGGKTLKERTRLTQVEMRLSELGKEISATRKELTRKPA